MAHRAYAAYILQLVSESLKEESTARALLDVSVRQVDGWHIAFFTLLLIVIATSSHGLSIVKAIYKVASYLKNERGSKTEQLAYETLETLRKEVTTEVKVSELGGKTVDTNERACLFLAVLLRWTLGIIPGTVGDTFKLLAGSFRYKHSSKTGNNTALADIRSGRQRHYVPCIKMDTIHTTDDVPLQIFTEALEIPIKEGLDVQAHAAERNAATIDDLSVQDQAFCTMILPVIQKLCNVEQQEEVPENLDLILVEAVNKCLLDSGTGFNVEKLDEVLNRWIKGARTSKHSGNLSGSTVPKAGTELEGRHQPSRSQGVVAGRASGAKDNNAEGLKEVAQPTGAQRKRGRPPGKKAQQKASKEAATNEGEAEPAGSEESTTNTAMGNTAEELSAANRAAAIANVETLARLVQDRLEDMMCGNSYPGSIPHGKSKVNYTPFVGQDSSHQQLSTIITAAGGFILDPEHEGSCGIQSWCMAVANYTPSHLFCDWQLRALVLYYMLFAPQFSRAWCEDMATYFAGSKYSQGLLVTADDAQVLLLVLVNYAADLMRANAWVDTMYLKAATELRNSGWLELPQSPYQQAEAMAKKAIASTAAAIKNGDAYTRQGPFCSAAEAAGLVMFVVGPTAQGPAGAYCNAVSFGRPGGRPVARAVVMAHVAASGRFQGDDAAAENTSELQMAVTEADVEAIVKAKPVKGNHFVVVMDLPPELASQLQQAPTETSDNLIEAAGAGRLAAGEGPPAGTAAEGGAGAQCSQDPSASTATGSTSQPQQSQADSNGDESSGDYATAAEGESGAGGQLGSAEHHTDGADEARTVADLATAEFQHLNTPQRKQAWDVLERRVAAHSVELADEVVLDVQQGPREMARWLEFRPDGEVAVLCFSFDLFQRFQHFQEQQPERVRQVKSMQRLLYEALLALPLEACGAGAQALVEMVLQVVREVSLQAAGPQEAAGGQGGGTSAHQHGGGQTPAQEQAGGAEAVAEGASDATAAAAAANGGWQTSSGG